jgi:hypothetical protein
MGVFTMSPQDSIGLLNWQLKCLGLPMLDTEVEFHPTRKWRFDGAYPDLKVAVECEGGTWLKKSRHTTGAGFQEDCVKYGEAYALGWTVLRGTPAMFKDGTMSGWIERRSKL